jgi:hypothetical protein
MADGGWRMAVEMTVKVKLAFDIVFYRVIVPFSDKINGLSTFER